MREFTVCLNCAKAITPALQAWIDAYRDGAQDKG
jgi:hypothetical protein